MCCQDLETCTSPQQGSQWVLKAQYTQRIVLIDLTYKYAKRYGGLVSTGRKFGGFGY